MLQSRVFPSNSSPSSTYGSMSPASSALLHPSSCSSSSSSTLLEHHQKDCSLCWSSQHNLTYAKSRTIRLRRKDTNTSLGFSIRGGWEHGIGFYVSEVQQQSLAAKKGLCPGDQILQINGFPLERVVHEEVVALIRMSSTDLHLRVRSAGIVPQKARPGEALTWKRLMSGQQQHSNNNNRQITSGALNGHCTAASGSSEVSSFVYTRPRSAASDSLTPSSASSSSEDGTSGHLCDHLHLPSGSEDSSHSTELICSSPVPLQSYSKSTTFAEKQLYIRCHQPGSSLGCSVVNGPLSCPGIFVQNVKEGKIASKCGLEVGDQIVKVNNIDVAVIGFEGAITLLKSLTNLSLLVRKGVARHIFECSHDQYHVFGSSSKECHFSQQQQHQFSTTKSLVKSPSESTLYYPSSSSSSTPPSYAYYHHHQYKTIQTSPLIKCHNNITPDPGTHFCSSAAYSTVQISSNGSPTCEKPRCCCKRQRTVTTTAAAAESPQIIYEPSSCGSSSANPMIASTCSSCTLVMSNPDHHHGHHHSNQVAVLPPPPPPSLFTTDPSHLDQVTSAMANSIRILREVREKEEKLVEASRKLSEEHQKLCREKEKLKMYELDKLPSDHSTALTSTIPTPPVMFESLSLNSQYSTLSTAPIGTSRSSSTSGPNGSTTRPGAHHSTVGPTFSFLEEIKALGENGTKRHLRPVASTDTLNGRGGTGTLDKGSSSDTMGSDSSKRQLLRRLPFGISNGNTGGSSKEAETKQRQHELLMEEFRIAHQRMFGGKENNGTLLAKIRAKAAANESELSPEPEVSKPPPECPIKETATTAYSAPIQMTKVISATGGGSGGSGSSTRIQNPGSKESLTPVARGSVQVRKQHHKEPEPSGLINSTNAANRITIKVLSPKIGS